MARTVSYGFTSRRGTLFLSAAACARAWIAGVDSYEVNETAISSSVAVMSLFDTRPVSSARRNPNSVP